MIDHGRVEAVLFDFTGVVADIRPALIGEDGPDWVLDVKDGVVEAISSLKRAGVPTCLVSNNDREALLGEASFDFDVFTTMVFSSDCGYTKPDRGIYEAAVRAVRSPAEACLFFDDLARNVDAAISLGMQGVIVESTETVIDAVGGLLESR